MTENQKPIVLNNVIGSTLSSDGWLPNQEGRILRILNALTHAGVSQALSALHLNFNPASAQLLSKKNGVLVTGLANQSLRPVLQSHVTSSRELVDLAYDQGAISAEGRDMKQATDIANAIDNATGSDPECIVSPSADVVKDLQTRMSVEVLKRLPPYLDLSGKVHKDLIRDFYREWRYRGCVYGMWWQKQGRKKHLKQHAHRFTEIANLLYDLVHCKATNLVLVGTVVAVPPIVTSWGDFSRVPAALQNEQFPVPEYVREVAEMEGIRFGLDALKQAPPKPNGLIERPHVTSVIVDIRRSLTEDQDRDPASTQILVELCDGDTIPQYVPQNSDEIRQLREHRRERMLFIDEIESPGLIMVRGFAKNRKRRPHEQYITWSSIENLRQLYFCMFFNLIRTEQTLESSDIAKRAYKLSLDENLRMRIEEEKCRMNAQFHRLFFYSVKKKREEDRYIFRRRISYCWIPPGDGISAMFDGSLVPVEDERNT